MVPRLQTLLPANPTVTARCCGGERRRNKASRRNLCFGHHNNIYTKQQQGITVPRGGRCRAFGPTYNLSSCLLRDQSTCTSRLVPWRDSKRLSTHPQGRYIPTGRSRTPWRTCVCVCPHPRSMTYALVQHSPRWSMIVHKEALTANTQDIHTAYFEERQTRE